MRFRDWFELKKHDFPAIRIADELQVSISYVHQLKNQKKLPSLKVALKIKKLTGNQVTLNDWEFDDIESIALHHDNRVEKFA